MVESELIIDNKEFNYTGIFSVKELFDLVNNHIDKLGYTRIEKKSEETVTPEGKEFYIELRPYKIKTNYITLMIKVKLHLTNVTDVDKEVQGIKQHFQQGNVKLVLDAWSITDYERRWNMKPWVFFMKAVINKYIYKFPSEEGFMNELGSDGNTIFNSIQDHLKNFVYEKGIEKKEELVKVNQVKMKK